MKDEGKRLSFRSQDSSSGVRARWASWLRRSLNRERKEFEKVREGLRLMKE